MFAIIVIVLLVLIALSEPLDEVGRMLGGWLRQVTLPPENNSRAAVK